MQERTSLEDSLTAIGRIERDVEDQVTMIELGDNVVMSPDAVETFQSPLVPLDEQLRRAAS